VNSAPDDLNAPTPESIAAYVKRHTPKARKVLAQMHDHSPAETIREVEHQGHHIVIGTTYRIEVDGHPVSGEFVVTDDGQVQCHALPNYTFASAVDLVKSMIDIFPEDFAGGRDPGHGHSGHDGHGQAARRGTKGRSARSSTSKKPASARRASKGRRHGNH